jgi:ankyrin repeat protein
MSTELSSALIAIKNGDGDALEQVFRDVTDMSSFLSAKIADESPTNHSIGKGTTLLQFASIRPWKDVDLSPVLLSRGATVDLHSACGLGKLDRISEILNSKPDSLASPVDTYFPIQYAITANRPESIARLKEHGDNPNRDLKKVAYFGWEDDAIELDYIPWKPIHMASLWGFNASRIPVARCLLSSGADINALSPLDGYRPVHLVAMSNRVDMIKFLIQNGADVDSRTKECKTIRLESERDGPCGHGFGNTALMIASGEGFLEAAECLIQLGADVTSRNDQGQTALHFASRKFWDGQQYDSVIKLLIDRGADKNARDDEGKSPTL